MRRVLVTGGAGFIGSSFIRYGLQKISGCGRLVNLDALTYASDLNNLASVADDARYCFVQGDIRDESLIKRLCADEGIDTLVHFAAESHVDRSITRPRVFIETNVLGTQALLEVVRQFPSIHFHHISTDEVYGSLGPKGNLMRNPPTSPILLTQLRRRLQITSSEPMHTPMALPIRFRIARIIMALVNMSRN